MAVEKPFVVYLFSLISGVFIFLNGLLFLVASGLIEWAMLGVGFDVSGAFIGGIGLFLGIIMIGSARTINNKPTQVKKWSVVILALSIASVAIGGGFAIGLILGLIGGIMGLKWKPERASKAGVGI